MSIDQGRRSPAARPDSPTTAALPVIRPVPTSTYRLQLHAGFTADGRTVGVQVAGRRFDDAGVLTLSAQIEELIGAEAPVRTVGVDAG